MRGRIVILVVIGVLAAVSGTSAEKPDRDAVVRALIERSRLLEDAHFEVPLRLWKRYLVETLPGYVEPAPVTYILEEARYHLTLSAVGDMILTVRLRLQVFGAAKCRNLPILSDRLVWKDVKLNGKPLSPATNWGWHRFTPTGAGEYVITAETALTRAEFIRQQSTLRVPRSVQTLLRVDSPGAWEIVPADDPRRIRGAAADGTHGEIGFTPRDRLRFTYWTPRVVRMRPAKYQLRGDVAWNLDAGSQQLTARLDIAILGGRTDRIALVVPANAERVSVDGPDVREARVTTGAVDVFLRGHITGKTRLTVGYERPRSKGARERLAGFTVRDGRWTDGTLVVTNTAGGSEVSASVVSGLREQTLAGIPRSASAILAGPPALAYEITSSQWSAEIDIISLGEFALTESIADLAHYELSIRPDGTMMGRASYEIRNRHRQFLRITLPQGARVLVARVNEASRPIGPAPGAKGVWLLPLVRSKASVEGLVSFPVEIIYLLRAGDLRGKDLAELPLPKIDLPIAYAWAEAYVPRAMGVHRWSGPLRRVDRFSSETATASLEYGSSRLAEGYTRRIKPVSEEEPPPGPKPRPVQPKPTVTAERRPPTPEKPTAKPGVDTLNMTFAKSISLTPSVMMKSAYASARLAKNYYRAGKDFYEDNDFGNARTNLEKAIELAPKSTEALNARRLLGNIKLAAGKLKLESKAQKAAGAQVLGEMKQERERLEGEQGRLIVAGLSALRRGKQSEARVKLEAAEAFKSRILAQGGGEAEQKALLSPARQALAGIRSVQLKQAQHLEKQVRQLERVGQYDEALKKTREIAAVDSRFQKAARQYFTALTVKAAKKRAEEDRKQQAFVRDVTVEVEKPPVGYDPDVGWTADGATQHRVLAQHGGVKVDLRDRGGKPSKVVTLRDGRDVIVDKLDSTMDELQEHLKDIAAKTATRLGTDTTLRGKAWTAAPKPVPLEKELLEDIARAERVPGRRKPLTGREDPMRRTRSETGVLRDAASADQIRIQLEEQEIRTRLSDGLVFLRERNFPRAEQKFLAAQLQVKYGDFSTPFKKQWLERTQKFLDLTAQTRAQHGKRVDQMRHREAAQRLQDELLRMKEQQRRIKERLAEQWRTFYDRQQYDDALLVLERMRELDPEDPTIPEKIKQTTHKKLAAWRRTAQMPRRPQVQYQWAGNIEQMTPWYPISVYPKNWSELSDRRLRAIERAEITERPSDRKVRQQLDETVVSFTLNEQPVASAFEFLETLGNINIVLDHSKLRDPDQTVTIKLNNVPLRTALKLVSEQVGLQHGTRNGIIFISDGEGIRRQPATQTYDVRDLLRNIPKFTGPTFELKDIAKAAKDSAALFDDEDESEDKGRSTREAQADLESLIRQTIAPGTWDSRTQGRGGAPGRDVISMREGTITVIHTPDTQAKVRNLLDDLRRAGGPQVEMGKRLTEQRAKGVLKGFDDFTNGIASIIIDTNVNGYVPHYIDTDGNGISDTSTGLVYDRTQSMQSNEELQRFIRSNYDWQWAARVGVANNAYINLNENGIGEYGLFNERDLAQKLVANLGQKVHVLSVNLNADAEEANGLGVNFTVGRNGLAYAVIDEAQFRTLMEFSDGNVNGEADANPSGQETIIGTDALIANGMVAHAEFAADRWNRLNILDNPVKLSHEKYILVNNGRFLTAVRAGAMQHWAQKSAPVFFASGPQHIDVPKVGRLVRFEKTLIEPKDDLVIRAKVYWKGGAW